MARDKRMLDSEGSSSSAAAMANPIKKKARIEMGSPVRPVKAPETQVVEFALSMPKRSDKPPPGIAIQDVLPVAVKRDSWPGLAGFTTWVHLGDHFSRGHAQQEKVWHDYLRDRLHGSGATVEVENLAEDIASAWSDSTMQIDDLCTNGPDPQEAYDPASTLYVIWLGYWDTCYEECEGPSYCERQHEGQSNDKYEDQTDVDPENGSNEQPNDKTSEESEGHREDSPDDRADDEAESHVRDGPEEVVDDEDETTDNESEQATNDESEGTLQAEVEPKGTELMLKLRRRRAQTPQLHPAKDPELECLSGAISLMFSSAGELYKKASARNFLIVDTPPADRAPGIIEQGRSDDARWFIQFWNERLCAAAREFAGDHEDVSLFVFSSHKVLSDLLDDPEAFGFAEEDRTEENGKIWTEHPQWGIDVSVSDGVHRLLADKITLAMSRIDQE
ncbi:hypothetical protein EVJ58_g8477 [Rhodofomes roseus]|uniref:Uncharacterized protein n=1 Tax=Rhodofomes roseus TaxID=34475 RepID=A0A4Y9XZG1_9APHY|nr:hypothetical protein EVJ58_g8477 [Rhodofomes roseus]